MEKFTLNILGCGSAFPTPLHNPSAQVVDFRDSLMMIDCGEGTQAMMRRMKLKFSRLNHIFISHMHGDHCLGLPGLLSTLAMTDRTGQVVVHLPAEGVDIVRNTVDFFCRERPYELVFNPISGDGGLLFENHALTVEAFPLYHRIPCFGFIFREKPKLRHINGEAVKFYQVPICDYQSLRQGEDYVAADGRVIANQLLTTAADPASSYAYCSDTMFDERVAGAVRGVDVIYHEATYAQDLAAQARERGHATASQAGRIAALAGAKTLIIGHYSKRYTDVEILVDEARAEFSNVIAAKEGLTIQL